MSDGVLKFLFVVTWLNVFILLEPFLNRDGYKAMIWVKGENWKKRAALFVAVNAAILMWAIALSIRL